MSNHLSTGKSWSLALNQTHIKSNFWISRMRASKEGALPAIWARMKETGRWDVLKLQWKEGMPNRPHHFWDSDVAKWTGAACYALTPTLCSGSDHSSSNPDDHDLDAFLASKISEAVSLISGAQWPDGYINSYFTVVEPGKRWTNIAWYHEHYCAGHLLEAAIAHDTYSISPDANYHVGSNSLLSPLLNYVALIEEHFGPDVAKGQKRGYPGHQELEIALLKLYEHLDLIPMALKDTGFAPFLDREDARKRILALASFFIHERGQLRDGLHYYDYEACLRNNDPPAKPGPAYPSAPRWMYNQAHTPIAEICSIEGHSVRAGYWLTAVAHLARVTRNQALQADARRLWERMTERKMHITGGIGAIGDWEGFGPDFYFPNESAYLETCASVALIFFAHQMLLLDPMDVRYGDILERALYNGALVGMSLDGKTFSYDNPLATVGKWRERSNWFEVSCCPPNIARLINSLGKYVYTQSRSTDKDIIHVHLLLASEASFTMQNGKEVKLLQESTAPWGGHVTICVDGPGSHQPDIVVRIPDWTHPDALKVSMIGYTHGVPNPRILCFTPHPTPSPSCQITLDFPVEPRLIYPHPLDTINHASLAVARGPFIYCAETVDNPAIGDLRQLRIPDGVHFEEVQVNMPSSRGSEVVGLKGRVRAIILPDQTNRSYQTEGGDWVILDQDAGAPEAIPYSRGDCEVDATLVPFFTWANRGRSDLRVWFPCVGMSC